MLWLVRAYVRVPHIVITASKIDKLPESFIDIHENIVFDDYNEMIAFCRENGIEIDLNEDTRTRWEEAKYMLLQIFDTNRQADGVLITKDKEIRILPSLAEFEYDPAYDGKVCVSIWRFDDYKEGVYVDENGDPWELA